MSSVHPALLRQLVGRPAILHSSSIVNERDLQPTGLPKPGPPGLSQGWIMMSESDRKQSIALHCTAPHWTAGNTNTCRYRVGREPHTWMHQALHFAGARGSSRGPTKPSYLAHRSPSKSKSKSSSPPLLIPHQMTACCVIRRCDCLPTRALIKWMLITMSIYFSKVATGGILLTIGRQHRCLLRCSGMFEGVKKKVRGEGEKWREC